MRTLAIWGTERSERREDITCQEWVKQGDSAALKLAFGPGFTHVEVITDPDGWGMSRARRCSGFLNDATVVWVGADVSQPALVQQQFRELFSGAGSSGQRYGPGSIDWGCGDAYFAGPPADVQLAWARHLASNRRGFLPDAWATPTQVDWQTLLTPGQKENLTSVESSYQSKYNGNGPLFSDLDQTTGERGDNTARKVGAYTTKGTFWSIVAQRVLSPHGPVY